MEIVSFCHHIIFQGGVSMKLRISSVLHVQLLFGHVHNIESYKLID